MFKERTIRGGNKYIHKYRGERDNRELSRNRPRKDIPFTIKDDKNKVNEIMLENVIYLPEATKNLISIAQWDEDKDDDYKICSKGKFSVFYWNDYSTSEKILHRLDCRIPLMPVNDMDESYEKFLQYHE